MVNFDINVFNNGAYNWDEDEWMLCPYTLENTSDGWGTGVELFRHNLVLNKQEALELGLGGNNDLWAGDDDWIDKDTLVREFGVSDRIKTWIEVVESVIDKQTAKV